MNTQDLETNLKLAEVFGWRRSNLIYNRAKIERHNDLITDLEGNINLMRSNPRAVRLLDYIIWKRSTT